jgi:hypothetical protein
MVANTGCYGGSQLQIKYSRKTLVKNVEKNIAIKDKMCNFLINLIANFNALT